MREPTNANDVIMRLLDHHDYNRNRIRELENRIDELEKHVKALADSSQESDSKAESENTAETDSEESEASEPFFKEIKPSDVSMKIRKNALKGYLEKLRDESGKFEGKSVYELSDAVFGHRPVNSEEKQYKAVYNALNHNLEFDTVNVNGQKMKKWRLNSKLA